MKKTILALLALVFVSLAISACDADSVAGTSTQGVVDNSLVNGSDSNSESDSGDEEAEE